MGQNHGKEKSKEASQVNVDSLEDANFFLIDSGAFLCPVCTELYTECPFMLPCSHSICGDCIAKCEVLEQRPQKDCQCIHGKCPLCSKQFSQRPTDQLPRNYALQSVLDSVSSIADDTTCPLEERTLRTLVQMWRKVFNQRQRRVQDLRAEREFWIRTLWTAAVPALICICLYVYVRY